MRKFAIIALAILLIGIDSYTKYYAELHLGWDQYIPLFHDFIWFKLSYNTGIAFSLPVEWIFLRVLTVLLLVWILFYYIHDEYQKKSRLLDIWYAFILSGAIGHTYERLFVGHVIDFIAVKYFAILNFADIFISVGALFLVLAYGIYSRTRS
jgi:signal peptidase II